MPQSPLPQPPQQGAALIPPLWTCGTCNAINGSNHVVCSSCGASKQSGQNQQVYYFAPNSNPTFVIPPPSPTPPPQKNSSVSYSFSIVGFLVFLAALCGISGSMNNLSQSNLIQTSPVNIRYFYVQAPQSWNIPIGANESVIIANGVTSNDVKQLNNVSYEIQYGPQTLQRNLSYGYIEYISPSKSGLNEYCRHLQQAVNNGIQLDHVCTTG